MRLQSHLTCFAVSSAHLSGPENVVPSTAPCQDILEKSQHSWFPLKFSAPEELSIKYNSDARYSSPKHPVSCIKAGLATCFIYDICRLFNDQC